MLYNGADIQSDSIVQGSVLFFFLCVLLFFILHAQPLSSLSKLPYFQPRYVSSLKHTKKIYEYHLKLVVPHTHTHIHTTGGDRKCPRILVCNPIFCWMTSHPVTWYGMNRARQNGMDGWMLIWGIDATNVALPSSGATAHIFLTLSRSASSSTRTRTRTRARIRNRGGFCLRFPLLVVFLFVP